MMLGRSVLLVMLCFGATGSVLADEKVRELESTKAKISEVEAENERLQALVKELELQSGSRELSVEEIEGQLKVIRASMEKPAR